MTGTRPGEYKQGFRPGAWDLLLRDPGSQERRREKFSKGLDSVTDAW